LHRRLDTFDKGPFIVDARGDSTGTHHKIPWLMMVGISHLDAASYVINYERWYIAHVLLSHYGPMWQQGDVER
jgi:hypothetical protein